MYISTQNYVGQQTTSLTSDGTASVAVEEQFAPYTGQVVSFREVGDCIVDFGAVYDVGFVGLCGVRCQSIAGVTIELILTLSGTPIHTSAFAIESTSYRDIYPHYSDTFTPIAADGMIIRTYNITIGDANLWMQRVWAGNLIQLDEVTTANFNVIDPSPIEKSSKGSMFILQKKLYRELSVGNVTVKDNLFAADPSEITDYEAVFEGFANVGNLQEVFVSSVGPQDAFHGHMITAPAGTKSAGLQYIFNANVREF